MPGRLGLVACNGALPVEIVAAHPDAFVVGLAGIRHQLGKRAQEHRIEKIGGLFEALSAARVTRLVFAGSLDRPAFDPSLFDTEMAAIAPRLAAAMQHGDDALLGEVIAIFEERGFDVQGAHQVLPGLVADPGLLAGRAPGEGDLADAARGLDILNALSPVDVGQGCVVAGGQCLGVETVQGTDFLLKYIRKTPDHLRRGAAGVFVKAAKAGQDLRIDMPAIGPRTVARVAGAGLGGMVIEAGRVMILDRDEVLEAVNDTGLFLMAVGG